MLPCSAQAAGGGRSARLLVRLQEPAGLVGPCRLSGWSQLSFQWVPGRSQKQAEEGPVTAAWRVQGALLAAELRGLFLPPSLLRVHWLLFP